MSREPANDPRLTTETDSATTGSAAVGRAVGDSAWVYGSQGAFVAFKFFAGFLVARFLGPTLYGLRTIFGIVSEYETLSHAGTFDAMQRDVPYHRGRGEPEEADRVIETVFGFSVAYAAAVCVGLLLVAAGMAWSGVTGIWLVFVLFMAFHVPVARIALFYSTLLIVDKEARGLSEYRVLRGAANALFGVSLAYFYSLEGLFAGILLADSVTLGWMVFRVGRIPGVRISMVEVRRLIAVGFPMMLVVLLFMILRSLDRILIAGFLSQELLGYFAVATILANVMFDTLADVMRVVLFPRMMEAWGKDSDRTLLKGTYLVEPSLLVAYGLPFILGAVYLGVHLPIEYLVPEYVEAIAVTKILIMGQFFFAVSLASILGGIAMNRQVNVAALTALVVLVNGILNYSFIQAGFGIEGVAVGTGLSYLVFTVITIRYVFAQLDAGWAEVGRFIALAILPFVYGMALLLLWEEVLLPVRPAPALVDLGHTALRIIGFTVLYTPILLMVARRPAVLQLREALSEAWARGRGS